MARIHAPIPFKQIRELKSTCCQYGPTAPFTLALLESMSTEALCPGDWKQQEHAYQEEIIYYDSQILQSIVKLQLKLIELREFL